MRLTIKGVLFLIPFFVSSVMAEVVVVVNPHGPAELSKTQIKKLYLGQVNRLANGEKAKVYELSKSSRLHKDFHSQITGRTPAQINSYWSKKIFTGKARAPEIISSRELLKREIAKNKNAIGYLDSSDVDDTVKVIYKP